ncbi:hypothetical protein GCM10010123_29630 [Pilimelia anulata]|uniref:Hint domain-containing protein n=1 Tax=Pilimelia anulata TaxID=53371 RepID=A0A8J3FAG9_9ACTN|nr:LamG-like jellyroll fold domain-containing protein [Pilimelia anulata]GGJ97687.1 hypothetical protein GCM10010123_29630 [Pilimelia anulata]
MAGLAAALVVNLGAPGAFGAPARPAAPVAPHAVTPKPQQRWGSADGLGHLAAGSANRHLPASTRGRFPLLAPRAVRPGNAASFRMLTAAPAAAGLRAGAVEVPEGAGPGRRLFRNPDGTQTTELSLAGPDVGSIGPSDAMYVHGTGSVGRNSEYLYVGRGPRDPGVPAEVDSRPAATYLKFDVDSIRRHTILGAMLSYAQAFAPTCAARAMTVHPVTEGWSSGGDHGYPGPRVGGSLARKSANRGYVPHGQQSPCPAGADAVDLGAAGAKLIQGWANGAANNGLSLRASTSDASAWKALAGPATPNKPKLYVTHSPYNAAYAIPNPRPNPEVTQARGGRVAVTVTNRGAADWKVGEHYLGYRIYGAADHKPIGQQKAGALPAAVPVGKSATIDALIQPLPPGAYLIDFSMVVKGAFYTDHQVPPGRLTLHVFDKPADIRAAFPPNGYTSEVLTPTLLVQAVDPDAPANSALQYRFELCDNDDDGNPIKATCKTTPYSTDSMWTVPVGRMQWSKGYTWSATVKDTSTEVPLGRATIGTAVPQPAIVGNLAGAPQAAQGREFDARLGNVSFTAVDATLAGTGLDPNVVRTYNSLDPRRDGLFGAGWSSRFDMRLTADTDGSGSQVVTYPDGQVVRFGRNADGTYAAPRGRVAKLYVERDAFRLKDRTGAVYSFGSSGRLFRAEDRYGKALRLTYDTQLGSGRLVSMEVLGNEDKPIRTLRIESDGKRIRKISTEPVNGAPLTWSYEYEGDLLRRVCGPRAGECAAYEYTEGSHYRTAVHDARPESYWRLGDPVGADAAASDVAVNLGRDAGKARNVTFGADGRLAGSPNKAASFNGVDSSIALPMGALKKARDAAVELWFKLPPGHNPGPLLAYQDAPAGSNKVTKGVPILYVDRDGFVRGQFATGRIEPIRAPVYLLDGKWHHVVLSAANGVQTLYVDGVAQGKLTGAIDSAALNHAQIGAGTATGAWPEWFGQPTQSFGGTIDEVALYLRPLGPEAVAAHYGMAGAVAHRLSKYTLPSGRVAAEAEYDADADRVREYTDEHGGTWEIGRPTVYGDATDLRLSVQVLDPRDHPYLYEYDALGGQMLRSGTPLGIEAVDDDPTRPTPSPSPTGPVEVCTKPDPGDPMFCTEIPSSGGGPVFVKHPLKGMAIRSFEYDRGRLRTIRNENGFAVELAYDKRGNVTQRRTCRTLEPAGGFGQCSTTYSTYPAGVTDPFDPLGDLMTESRDGRSADARDETYLTRLEYDPFGAVRKQTSPGWVEVAHRYTTGFSPAADGGTTPPGLLAATTDAKGKETTYAYYRTGDLARVTEPSGLRTEYAYDGLGRKLTEKVISDTHPAGATTTYTYEEHGWLASATGPATRNAVTGAEHQQQTTYAYDPDGALLSTTVADLKSDAPKRTTTTEYDEYRNAVRTVDAEGGETTYDHDRFGNKVLEVDANGNQYAYRYTAAQKIAEVRLRDWRDDPEDAPRRASRDLVLHSYSYDYAGRLASDTDAMGRRLEYSYLGDDLLHRIVLKNLVIPGCTKPKPEDCRRDYVVEENSYDNAGHLVRRTGADGKRVQEFGIDPAGRMTFTADDPNGLDRRTAFLRDGNGNVTRTNRYGRPSNMPGFFRPDRTEQVEFDYSPAGRVTEERVRDVDGKQVRTTGHAYDQRGLPLSTTDPRGYAEGADKSAYTTTFAHDELGRQTSVTAPEAPVEAGSARRGPRRGAARASTVSGYDAFGDLVAVRDPRGHVTRTEYDRLGRPVKRIAPAYRAPGSDSTVTPTEETAYDALGNAVRVRDAEGNETRLSYDRLNHVITRDEPAGDGGRAIRRYTYYRTGEIRSVTDPTGAYSESTYDELDRLTSVTQVERRPARAELTTLMTYTPAGDLATVTSPTGAVTTHRYDAAGDRTGTTSPNGVTIGFGYDQFGRLARTIDGRNRVVRTDHNAFGERSRDWNAKPASDPAADEMLREQRYRYDDAGNLVESIDPDKQSTTYEYDALNRLAKQVEPVSADESITTTFGYDVAGNRARYTDGRGHSTFYTTNSLGLPESVIEPRTDAHPEPDQRTWTVGYDPLGRARRLVAPGNVARERTYDAAGRLRTETGTGAEAGTAERRLGYDAAGRLTTSAGPKGTSEFTYNDRGALIGSTGAAGRATFAFDGDGNMVGRTDAAGTATFGYDRGRLDTVTDAATGATQRYGYDAAGATGSIDYGAGRVRTFDYDAFGQLSTDVLRNATGATVASVTYAYDLNGHLTQKKTAGVADAGTNAYAYDRAGRLTKWTGPRGTVDYAWDRSGNRTRAGPKTSTYDERNRLLADGDYTYAYTARGTRSGRTSSGLTEPYSFDAFDRLVRADKEEYAYDSLDRVADRNGVDFAYAGTSDEPVGDGEQQFARGPADELLAVAQGDRKHLTLLDAHDDVVGTLDPADSGAATLPASTSYDPFGQVTARTGETGRIGFQGDWTAPGTGRVNMGARWYEPNTGGFASRDSVAYRAGDSILANRYAYGAGAPLDHADPDGHWPGWLDRARQSAGNMISGAISAVGHAVNTGIRFIGSALRTVGHYLSEGAKWLYQKVRAGVSWVAEKVGQGMRALRAGFNWAKERAAAIARAAYERAREVTRQARAAIDHAIKHTVLPVLKAVTKPVLNGLKAVVSATAKLPAAVVSVARQAIADPAKFARDLYERSVEAAGAVVETVSQAAQAVGQFVADNKAAIIGAVAGIAVGIGCGVAIGWTGVGAVACGALAGAVGSAVTGAINGERGMDLVKSTVGGALLGGLTGGLGSVAGAGLKAGIGALSGGLRGAGTAARQAMAGEAGEIAAGRLSGGALRGARPCNSFTPTTAVLMADGSSKPIADVKVGEMVRATDPTTGKTESRAVTDVIAGDGDKSLVEITVESGRGKAGKVTATDGHHFWAVDLRRWVEAKDLKPGYRFLTADNRPTRVLGTRSWRQQQPVYNLTVDGLHSYYVSSGASDVLVHNCGRHELGGGRHRQAGEGYVGRHRAPEYKTYHGRHFAEGPPDYVGAHRADTLFDKLGAKIGPQVHEAGHQGWELSSQLAGLVEGATTSPALIGGARGLGFVIGGVRGWMAGARDGANPWRLPVYTRPHDFT